MRRGRKRKAVDPVPVPVSEPESSASESDPEPELSSESEPEPEESDEHDDADEEEQESVSGEDEEVEAGSEDDVVEVDPDEDEVDLDPEEEEEEADGDADDEVDPDEDEEVGPEEEEKIEVDPEGDEEVDPEDAEVDPEEEKEETGDSDVVEAEPEDLEVNESEVETDIIPSAGSGNESDEDDEGEPAYRNVSFQPLMTLYVDTWLNIVGKRIIKRKSLQEFAVLLPQLRAQLLCSVCEQLLPSSPSPLAKFAPSRCTAAHAICRGCAGKQWKTQCQLNCDNTSNYEESSHLSIVIKSYRDFCALFLNTTECVLALRKKAKGDPSLIFDILDEGVKGNVPDTEEEGDDLDSDDSDDDDDEKVDPSPRTIVNTRQSVKEETKLEIDDLENNSSQPKSEPASDPSENKSPSPEPEPIPEPEPKFVDQEENNCGRIKTPEIYPGFASVRISHFADPKTAVPMARIVALPPTNPPKQPPSPQRNSPIPAHKADPNSARRYAAGAVVQSGPRYSNLESAESSITAVSMASILGSVVRAVDGGVGKMLKVRLPKTSASTSYEPESKSLPSTSRGPRKGCRCGNATAMPGKLTCCGQRCPCYVERKSCLDCRCKGCRNPHLPGGRKLLQGISAVVDTLTNTTTPLPTPTVSASVYAASPRQGGQATFSPMYPLTSVANFGGFSVPVQLPLSIVDVTSIIPPRSQQERRLGQFPILKQEPEEDTSGEDEDESG